MLEKRCGSIIAVVRAFITSIALPLTAEVSTSFPIRRESNRLPVDRTGNDIDIDGRVGLRTGRGRDQVEQIHRGEYTLTTPTASARSR